MTGKLDRAQILLGVLSRNNGPWTRVWCCCPPKVGKRPCRGLLITPGSQGYYWCYTTGLYRPAFFNVSLGLERKWPIFNHLIVNAILGLRTLPNQGHPLILDFFSFSLSFVNLLINHSNGYCDFWVLGPFPHAQQHWSQTVLNDKNKIKKKRGRGEMFTCPYLLRLH